MPPPASKRRRRIAVWALAAAVIAAAAIVALWPAPVPVDLAAVTRGDLQVTIDHEGKTRVHDRYTVSAPVAGRVLRIDLRPGDRVARGSTVVATLLPGAPALLDTRTRAEAEARAESAEAAVAQASAALQDARVQQGLAATQRDRARQLARQGAGSQADVDAADAEARSRDAAVQAATAAVSAAGHDRDAARAALVAAAAPAGTAGAIELRAPVDGVVLERLHESEAVVPAGEPLLVLANPAELEIVSDYLSSDAVRMRPGMPALIDRWGGGDFLHGHVRLVEPDGFLKVSALGVEEQRVNVVIAFDDPRTAWASLGDGYRIESHVVVWQQANVLKAPTSALFRDGADWAVFVVEAGRARRRIVPVGAQTGLEAQILGGLAVGDEVVVHPSDAVRDGVRVAPRSN